MFPFSHFHSNVHEALGVFRGSALLQFGGDTDTAIQENVTAGDLILIPAGGAAVVINPMLLLIALVLDLQ